MKGCVFTICFVLLLFNVEAAENQLSNVKLKLNGITEMILIKGGCFEMGDIFADGRHHEEKPVHEVCINDFYLGKYEVTQGEWKKIMENNPSDFSACGENCPVEKVSWNDVQEYIQKLNGKTGKQFRLPSEAEWEYAARSGGKREKWSGFSIEDDLEKYVNFCDSNCEYTWNTPGQNDGYKNTSPVGSLKPNSLGLYDMTGNVWEWIGDWFEQDYYRNSSRDNPRGPDSGSLRVLRGGSWTNRPAGIRVSNRARNEPHTRLYNLGFRLAKDKN